MVLKSRKPKATARKIKPVKGGSAKKSAVRKSTKPTKGGSVVKRGMKTVGGVFDRAMGAYTGSSTADIKRDFSKGKSAKSEGGKRRRKGLVPKTVRKWAGKMARRRKQEEKVVKKLFGSDGGKIVKSARKSRFGSPGVITRSEAMEAMRR